MGGSDYVFRLVTRVSRAKRQPRALKLMICVNMVGVNKPCCGKRGSVALAEAIERGVRDRRIALKVERIHCFNKCHVGPNMRIAPGGEFLEGVSDGDIPCILDRLETMAGRTDHKPVAEDGLIYPGG